MHGVQSIKTAITSPYTPDVKGSSEKPPLGAVKTVSNVKKNDDITESFGKSTTLKEIKTAGKQASKGEVFESTNKTLREETKNGQVALPANLNNASSQVTEAVQQLRSVLQEKGVQSQTYQPKSNIDFSRPKYGIAGSKSEVIARANKVLSSINADKIQNSDDPKEMLTAIKNLEAKQADLQKELDVEQKTLKSLDLPSLPPKIRSSVDGKIRVTSQGEVKLQKKGLSHLFSLMSSKYRGEIRTAKQQYQSDSVKTILDVIEASKKDSSIIAGKATLQSNLDSIFTEMQLVDSAIKQVKHCDY